MSDLSIPQKRCAKCNKQYPATTEWFHRDKQKADGLYSSCKSCKNAENNRWKQQHPEESMAAIMRWHKAHPDKAKAARDKRKDKALIESREWWQVKLAQDHVIPVAQGGPYTADNIVPCCISCNSKKKDRTPEQAGMKLREKHI